MTIPIVVLLSGNGSNLQALIENEANGQLKGHIAGVISDNPKAYGLKRAQAAHIPTTVVNYKHYDSREAFCDDLKNAVNGFAPQLVVLAGFMRLLTPTFVTCFYGHLINIHPSLLPKYPGLDTHRQVLAHGDRVHGITIHFVNAVMDAGPIICQSSLQVKADEDETALKTRIHQLEHIHYTKVINDILAGHIYLQANKVWFKQQLITETDYYLTENS